MTRRTLKNLKAYVMQKYGGHCQSCGVKTIDVVVPPRQTMPDNLAVVGLAVSKLYGGERTRDNALLFCNKCQSDRHNKELYEYGLTSDQDD
jgi:5-methylcytosine-specific restriction endonuclease McrA